MSRETDLSANQIEQLDEALVQLALGAALDDVLAEAGANAAWLRPLLMAATEVKQLPPPHPLPAPDASLQRMLAHADTLRAAPPAAARPSAVASPASPGLWARLMAMFAPALRSGVHVAALAASILIAFLAGTLLGTGAIFAAQQSLPGDPGYGLKRTIEDVQLGLTINPARREYLQAQFNDRRQLEAELLLEQGREAEIVFEDKIQTVNDNSLVLGLAINITDSTEIEGLLTPGARVRLEAITAADGQVTAVKIVVIQPGTPAASPTPTASPSPTVTASPTATATAPAQTGDTLILPLTPTPSPSPTPDAEDQMDDPASSNSSNDFEDNTDNIGDDNSNNNSDDFDDNSGANNDNEDAFDDDTGNNNGSDDDINNNGDDNDFDDDSGSDNGNGDDFTDDTDDSGDGSNDNSDDFDDDSSGNVDDDLSDDDFADDAFDDDSGNDNNDDSSSDDSSGNDNSNDSSSDDNSGSGSDNSGSGSIDSDDSDNDAPDDDN